MNQMSLEAIAKIAEIIAEAARPSARGMSAAQNAMVRQSARLWRTMLRPGYPGTAQAAALAPVGTVEIVFSTCEAIW